MTQEVDGYLRKLRDRLREKDGDRLETLELWFGAGKEVSNRVDCEIIAPEGANAK